MITAIANDDPINSHFKIKIKSHPNFVLLKLFNLDKSHNREEKTIANYI